MVDLVKNENVVFQVRRHMFVFYARSFFVFLIAVAPLFLFGIVYSFFNFSVALKTSELLWFAYSFFLLIVWNWFFMEWTDYYLDVWILTDKRLIDVEQRGLFHRKVSSLDLRNIQDIKIETKGLIATFLKFGDIHVQTAGADREFVIREAYNPELVKRQLTEAYQLARSNKKEEDTDNFFD